MGSEKPFNGIRVVDFGQFVTVPFAAQLLAQGGAEVVKVEALKGDPTRNVQPLAANESLTFICRNCGKHSLPLALGDPKAKPIVNALLEWADVALINIRPGLAKKLGLDKATLTSRFPRLVIGYVTAFGAKGPEANAGGFDMVIQARSGLMASNGRVTDGRPDAGDAFSADYMCAMTLAFGVSAALLRRERTGRGGAIETTLLQGALTLLNSDLIRSEDQDTARHLAELEHLKSNQMAGVPYTEQLKGMSSVRSVPWIRVYYRTYATRDTYIAVACGSHALRVKFIDAIGLVDSEIDTIDLSGLTAHYDELALEVERLMMQNGSGYWIDHLHKAGVPVSPVTFPLELFDDPQPEANDMFTLLAHPGAGNIKMLAPPLKLSDEGFIAAPPMSILGSATDSILRTVRFTGEQIDEFVGAGVTRRN